MGAVTKTLKPKGQRGGNRGSAQNKINSRRMKERIAANNAKFEGTAGWVKPLDFVVLKPPKHPRQDEMDVYRSYPSLGIT